VRARKCWNPRRALHNKDDAEAIPICKLTA
jgi:hypothetical protein